MQKTGTVEICLICGRKFYVPLWWKRNGGGRYCSTKCGYKSRLGKSSWNKGKKMPFKHRKMSLGFLPKMSFKKGNIPWNKGKTIIQTRNEKNGQWRGNDVGYDALHDWIKLRLGLPKQCELCKTIKSQVYHWANKSGDYKRDTTDWIRLCVPCHKKYDLKRKYEKKVFRFIARTNGKGQKHMVN